MVRTWSEDDPKAKLMTRKRAQIVEAALKAFLEHGYAESSVNRIAQDAGVSIKTLYRHFESKDELFSAVMQAACSPHEDGIASAKELEAEPSWFTKPPEAALPLAGEEYLRHILSDRQLALYRVVARDAHSFPELGRRYREEVMSERVRIFAAYIDRWQPKMGWKISDRLSALATFGSMLRASLFDDAVMGFRKPKEREISRRAREAAARFLVLLESAQF